MRPLMDILASRVCAVIAHCTLYPCLFAGKVRPSSRFSQAAYRRSQIRGAALPVFAFASGERCLLDRSILAFAIRGGAIGKGRMDDFSYNLFSPGTHVHQTGLVRPDRKF